MRNIAPCIRFSQELPEQNVAPQDIPVTQPGIAPQQDGVLVLRKPGGPSSAWCINRIKRELGQKKIGHAGTLDPMASGVLLVLLGQATKISGYLMESGDKIYSGIIRLGVITDTWDATGRTLEENPVSGITPEDVRRELAPLVGSYMQQVPAYSAAKHEGRPLYALARKGIAAPIKEKRVIVSRCEAELVGPGRIHFRVTCSSGTYIRSLAHSLGKRLGCGGMLEELTREHSHPFGLEAAHSLESVLSQPEDFAAKVVGIADALPDWPRIRATPQEEAGIRNGRGIRRDDAAPFAPGARAILLTGQGLPLALAEASSADGGQEWTVLRGLWNQ
jgi:tRNA pseudouridine55 synthase